MAKLYIITGPAGVGKSTVSKKLAEKCSKSVLIEGDEIYHQVIGGYVPAWQEGNHLEIFWEICFNTIKIYLKNEFNVIFNYIISPEKIELIKKEFSEFEIKFVVLMTDEKTLLLRDGQRDDYCQMKERCVVLLNKFKNRNYNKNNVLDSSGLSVEETVEIINGDRRFVV